MTWKHRAEIDQLFKAILSLQNIDECYAFFEDACTIKEIQDIAQRLDVAAHLKTGKNYNEVNQITGASTATICRVKKCLTYGEGYQLVLDRLEASEET